MDYEDCAVNVSMRRYRAVLRRVHTTEGFLVLWY
jgi:hypothetical protein